MYIIPKFLVLHFGENFIKSDKKITKLQMHKKLHKNVHENMFSHSQTRYRWQSKLLPIRPFFKTHSM